MLPAVAALTRPLIERRVDSGEGGERDGDRPAWKAGGHLDHDDTFMTWGSGEEEGPPAPSQLAGADGSAALGTSSLAGGSPEWAGRDDDLGRLHGGTGGMLSGSGRLAQRTDLDMSWGDDPEEARQRRHPSTQSHLGQTTSSFASMDWGEREEEKDEFVLCDPAPTKAARKARRQAQTQRKATVKVQAHARRRNDVAQHQKKRQATIALQCGMRRMSAASGLRQAKAAATLIQMRVRVVKARKARAEREERRHTSPRAPLPTPPRTPLRPL